MCTFTRDVREWMASTSRSFTRNTERSGHHRSFLRRSSRRRLTENLSTGTHARITKRPGGGPLTPHPLDSLVSALTRVHIVTNQRCDRMGGEGSGSGPTLYSPRSSLKSETLPARAFRTRNQTHPVHLPPAPHTTTPHLAVTGTRRSRRTTRKSEITPARVI